MLRAELTRALGDLRLELELEVAPASCLALAGPSGAGKTTVLAMLAGTAAADAGRIVCGEEVWLDSERHIAWPPEARRCGYLFQDHALFPHLSAWRNVAYPMRGLPRRRRRAAAFELLERLGVAGRAQARPGTLSGGERQRVALARALARRPRVLLLDEPLSALDPRSAATVRHELAAVLRSSEVPAILVTHDFADAALLADQIAVIDRGRVVQQGSASDLAGEPASPFVADFTGAVVLSGTARVAPEGLATIALDGGGEVRALARDAREGPVAVGIYPWEITLEPAGAPATGSAQNRLPARVMSLTSVGGRVRVGLQAHQPLVAEVTAGAAQAMGLAPGSVVTACWKATATRVIAM
jgi:molybdate transport system ATP-binding protein